MEEWQSSEEKMRKRWGKEAVYGGCRGWEQCVDWREEEVDTETASGDGKKRRALECDDVTTWQPS